MRGRKPIPTHLKVLRGNPGHQALRPEHEPDYLSADQVGYRGRETTIWDMHQVELPPWP